MDALKGGMRQVIDDTKHHTYVGLGTVGPYVKERLSSSKKSATKNVEAASVVGRLIAERCLEQGIEKVVFDRGGYRYHGKVKVRCSLFCWLSLVGWVLMMPVAAARSNWLTPPGRRGCNSDSTCQHTSAFALAYPFPFCKKSFAPSHGSLPESKKGIERLSKGGALPAKHATKPLSLIKPTKALSRQ